MFLQLYPAYAVTKEQAFHYGQLLNIWGFCQNSFTKAGKEILEVATDAPELFPEDYKKGFQSVSNLSGYRETEERNLGTKAKNQFRQSFCNNVIAVEFNNWVNVKE